MTSRPTTAAPILAVLAIGLVMLGVYVGGYLLLGERDDAYPMSGRLVRIRVYDSVILMKIFEPAAECETRLTGHETITGWNASP